jgi:hypothetical protein
LPRRQPSATAPRAGSTPQPTEGLRRSRAVSSAPRGTRPERARPLRCRSCDRRRCPTSATELPGCLVGLAEVCGALHTVTALLSMPAAKCGGRTQGRTRAPRCISAKRCPMKHCPSHTRRNCGCWVGLRREARFDGSARGLCAVALYSTPLEMHYVPPSGTGQTQGPLSIRLSALVAGCVLGRPTGAPGGPHLLSFESIRISLQAAVLLQCHWPVGSSPAGRNALECVEPSVLRLQAKGGLQRPPCEGLSGRPRNRPSTGLHNSSAVPPVFLLRSPMCWAEVCCQDSFGHVSGKSHHYSTCHGSIQAKTEPLTKACHVTCHNSGYHTFVVWRFTTCWATMA